MRAELSAAESAMYASYNRKREAEGKYGIVSIEQEEKQGLFNEAKAAFDAAVTAKAATDKKAKDAARAEVASEYKNSSEDREYAKILL